MRIAWLYRRSKLAKCLNEKTTETQNIDGWLDSNDRFHRFFVNHCGNAVLQKMAYKLLDSVMLYRFVVSRAMHFDTQAPRYYSEVAKQMRVGDAEGAAPHIDHSAQMGMGCFDER